MSSPLPEPELRLSWSKIRTHEECHQKAHLKAAGVRSPISDIRGYFQGTVVDRAMRQWLDRPDPEPGWMAAKVGEILEQEEVTARETGDGIVKWRSASDKGDLVVWCTELVNRLEPILYEKVIPLNYQPAVRFRTPLIVPHPDGGKRTIILNGEMDLLCQFQQPDGRYVVWDLKGTNDSGYWRKVVGQLVFYEIAVHGMFSAWPAYSGLIQPMCPERLLYFQFTQEHRMDMFGRIVKVAQDIWRGDVAPKASAAGCDRCEVRRACIRFPPKVSGRRQLITGL